MSARLFVPFIVSLIINIQEASSCCPDGWISYKQSCYLFADEQKIDWNEAVSYCRIKNSNLVTIETENENRFLKYFSNKLYKPELPQRNITALWIGASDTDIEGIWKWVATDEELTYVEWNTGACDSSSRPAVTLDNKEDCVALNGAYGFCWHDGICRERVGYALCEKHMTGAGDHKGMQIIG